MRLDCRVALCALVCLAASSGRAGDISTSKHNLSTSSSVTIKAQTESRICVFCHTPHNAKPAQGLWNHEASLASYSTYASTTMSVPTPLQQPTGSSKLCLACHDGTVALGQTVNNGLMTIVGADPSGKLTSGGAALGLDLTDDHPISFVPNAGNPQTIDPPGGDPITLDPAGEVQCTSCHDPHREDTDPIVLRFLVKDNRGSALCTTCHIKDYWQTNPSSHQSSIAPYTVTEGAHTGYNTVGDNGCESCHRPHSGNEPQRLVKFTEELTCDKCHDGAVAAQNISAEFTKLTVHPVYDVTPSIHDAAESPSNPSATIPEVSPTADRHAECADCHNPHAAFDSPASVAGGVTGRLSGTWGINSAGVRVDPAASEYQVCYKCHADSANKPQESGLPYGPYTQRQLVEFNVRREFDPGNPSYHPIEAPGKNNDVPSLIGGWDETSIMSCTDCHNNDTGPGAGGGGPTGPHGSNYDHLLERNLLTGSNNGSSNLGQKYAMCFKCHSQTSILSDNTFGDHKKHIEGEGTSCSVCHDPHGASAAGGATVSANSHLINFDTSIVQPSSGGQLRFEDRGVRNGACYLTCHGKNHNPLTY